MKTIQIKGKDYKIKNTIRAIFIFEQITGRVFEIKNTMDNYIYFYSILLANNPDFLQWEDFIDALDENPNILVELNKKLTESQEMENLLNPDNSDNESEDKKKE